MTLKQRAVEIRDETVENANTSERIGSLFEDIVDHISGATDLFPPYVADKTITTSVTSSTYDATVNEAVDTATPKTAITYYLVEGSLFQLVDKDLIQNLNIIDQGNIGAGDSTITLSGSGSSGETKRINVFAEDEAGNVTLYTNKEITLS